MTERNLAVSSAGSVGLTDGSPLLAMAVWFLRHRSSPERNLEPLSRQPKVDRSHRNRDTTGAGADGGIPDDTVLA